MKKAYPVEFVFQVVSLIVAVILKCIKQRKGVNGFLAVRPVSRMYFCFAGYVPLTEPVVSPTVLYPDVRSR